MNSGKTLRIFGLVISTIGAVATIVSSVIDDKKQEIRIDEAVEQAVADRFKQEGS